MERFEEDWTRCAPWLEAALEYTGGTHTLEDVRLGVLHGAYQFWPFARCAIVTELVNYPRLRALRFFLVGGDMDALLEVEGGIAKWGSWQGCSRVECAGRRGWEKVLGKAGYQFGCVYLVREL